METPGHAPAFVDTNVLVYALAADDDLRAPAAQDLLRHLMRTRALRLSTQVLQETFVTLTRRVRGPLDANQALRYLDELATFPVVAPDYTAIRDAVELSVRAKLSFWDALVAVAAARSAATVLYSEDLNDGQVILGVEVVNPFRSRIKKR